MSTVLITGAGRGIGLATARAFLAAGWKVLALDKDFSKFDLKGAERAYAALPLVDRDVLWQMKRMGFSDRQLGDLRGESESAVRSRRIGLGIIPA